MKVDEIGRTRLGRVIAVGLVVIGIATAYAATCDCEIRAEPIFRGVSVVADPDKAIAAWRLASELNASDITSVSIGEDDRTLDIAFEGGNRAAWLVAMIGVSESPDRIVLGIYGGFHRLPRGTFYTLEGVLYRVTVRLAHLVAGRDITYVERLSSPFDR